MRKVLKTNIVWYFQLSATVSVSGNVSLLSGFYTGWLLPAAMVGLSVFLYGLFTLDHNISAREVCSDQARK